MSAFVYTVGAASSGTSVSLDLSPRSGTPSSIANGATLDATMLDGWKVWDPTGYLTGGAITDSGTVMTVQATGQSTNAYTGSGLWTNASLFLDTWLSGDFSAELKYAGESNMTTGGTWIGLAAGQKGNASPYASFNSASAGHKTASYRNVQWNSAVSSASGSTLFYEDASNVAWATAAWMQIKREGSTVTVSQKTGDDDDWTVTKADTVDLIGARFQISIMFAPYATKTFSLYALRLTGAEAAE